MWLEQCTAVDVSNMLNIKWRKLSICGNIIVYTRNTMNILMSNDYTRNTMNLLKSIVRNIVKSLVL